MNRVEDAGITWLEVSPPALGTYHHAPLIAPIVTHHDGVGLNVSALSHQCQAQFGEAIKQFGVEVILGNAVHQGVLEAPQVPALPQAQAGIDDGEGAGRLTDPFLHVGCHGGGNEGLSRRKSITLEGRDLQPWFDNGRGQLVRSPNRAEHVSMM